MIKIYYRGSCASSKNAIKWFEIRQMEFKIIKIRDISRVELIKVLSLTDKGIYGIVKNPDNSKITSLYIKKIRSINAMNFNEALSYLEENPAFLKTPIIIGDNKCMVGFNNESIREFIPRKYRRVLP